MPVLTHDGLTIPDGEAKTYVVYRNPDTSEVSSEHRTLCGALATAAPSWNAEIVHNGLAMAVVFSGDVFIWALTDAGKHELGHEALMIEERWRR